MVPGKPMGVECTSSTHGCRRSGDVRVPASLASLFLGSLLHGQHAARKRAVAEERDIMFSRVGDRIREQLVFENVVRRLSGPP
jgi:hypothetical protein